MLPFVYCLICEATEAKFGCVCVCIEGLKSVICCIATLEMYS